MKPISRFYSLSNSILLLQVDLVKVSPFIHKAIKKLVADKKLIQVKANFKAAKEEKPKPKKTAAKKSPKKKAAKKTTVKKAKTPKKAKTAKSPQLKSPQPERPQRSPWQKVNVFKRTVILTFNS